MELAETLQKLVIRLRPVQITIRCQADQCLTSEDRGAVIEYGHPARGADPLSFAGKRFHKQKDLPVICGRRSAVLQCRAEDAFPIELARDQ